MNFRTQLAVISILILISAGCLFADEATQSIKVGTSQLKVPQTWKRQQPSSRFRIIQLAIPKTQDDEQDGSLIVYFFGKGGGGGVEANLRRWKGQFEDVKDPGGKVEKLVVQGVNITTLDISGTYKDRPFPASPNFTARKDYRMLTAVVETEDGPYYFRLLGPGKSVAAQAKAWSEMLNSLQTE